MSVLTAADPLPEVNPVAVEKLAFKVNGVVGDSPRAVAMELADPNPELINIPTVKSVKLLMVPVSSVTGARHAASPIESEGIQPVMEMAPVEVLKPRLP